MSHHIRTAAPDRDTRITGLLDAAFARDSASRMVRALAKHPDFDEDLCLIAEREGEVVGSAIFLPRTIRLLGQEVAVGACATLAVLPTARDQGIGRELLEDGLDRLKKRGARAAIAIGAPYFYSGSGFAPAFDLYACRVPTEIVSEQASTELEDAWRGLTGGDLARVTELFAESYARVEGSEVRKPDAVEWESAAEDSYALCCEVAGEVIAYLRFRVRETVEVTECAVASPTGVTAVLSMLARLGNEHARPLVEVHSPPDHPVARALFHLGCPIDTSDFGGAAMMCVLDRKGLLTDIAPGLRGALMRAAHPALSLGIDGENVRLSFVRGELVAREGKDERNHVEIPDDWAPGLITGHRTGAELAFRTPELDEEVAALVTALFPRRTPAWTYGPLFEIADD